MVDDARMSPGLWSTTSPWEFDRLARGVLSAARAAARELRQDPPDEAQRAWALGLLAGQTRAMLGPDLPGPLPVGIEAQEEFVRTALALAVHVRAHSWAAADLGERGVQDRPDVPHPGERHAKDAFDVLGRLLLPHSSPEGWTATLVTDLARGDQKLETAVKVGKYILHPTFLALADDATRVIGEALNHLNVRRLYELATSLRDCTGALGPSLPEPGRPSVTESRAPAEPDVLEDVHRGGTSLSESEWSAVLAAQSAAEAVDGSHLEESDLGFDDRLHGRGRGSFGL